MAMSLLYRVRIIVLYLSVFFLQVADYNPLNIIEGVTPHFLCCLLYVILSIFLLSKKYLLLDKPLKNHIKMLLLLFGWITITSLLSQIFIFSDQTQYIIRGNWTFSVILYCCLVIELYGNQELLRKLLLGYIFSTLIIGLLVYFEIGKGIVIEEGQVRLKFLGNNPNALGQGAVISVCIALVFLFKFKYNALTRVLIMLSIPVSIIIIQQSGSRGAFYLLVAAVFVIPFLLFRGGKKYLLIPILSVIGLFLIDYLLQTESILTKRLDTTEESNWGGRLDIWSHVVDIIMVNPVVGVGTTGYADIITSKLGFYHDTHNVFLYYFVTGGIVGLCIFILFLRPLIANSFRLFFVLKDPLSLILLFILFLSFIKSGGAHSSRSTYFYFAFISLWSVNSLIKWKTDQKGLR